jgi:hypothetical protein
LRKGRVVILFTRTGLKCFFGLYFALGALMFIPLLAGLPGYLTTSARTPYCRAHPPGPEGCPLDYAMLAADLLLGWGVFMVKFLLPLLFAGAVLVVVVRWICLRLGLHGRRSAAS